MGCVAAMEGDETAGGEGSVAGGWWRRWVGGGGQGRLAAVTGAEVRVVLSRRPSQEWGRLQGRHCEIGDVAEFADGMRNFC